jgi:hypothetical protein
MSNSLAIAAVTATLQNMLNDTQGGITATLPQGLPNNLGLGSVSITTKPLDKARAPNDNNNQVNIFLYQTLPNAAMRNMDMPRQVRPGETAQPPVALTLHYLLSAYGKDDDDTIAHILLGQAIRIFHDNSVLDQGAIKDSIAGNDLYEQVERVRLTPFPLSSDEIAKLWTAFQTQYRISAAYQADVVLIESRQASRTPLPVLTRGSNNSGISAQPDLIPPFPAISNVQPPKQQASAKLGDSLTISGFHLDGDTVSVRFSSSRLTVPRVVPATGTAELVTLTVPDDPGNLPAGFYTVAVIVTKAGQPDRTTNELPLQIAPTISNINPQTAPAGDVTFTLTCSPEIQPEQRASLLFGNVEILAQPLSVQSGTLDFAVNAAAAGDYYLRLRVDGVDSLLVDRTVTPPQFDPTQKVTITP